ncbi:MAG: nucleotidyltransferase domain-containing protein [Candidatus Woesearchaeota archaeon]
MEADIEKIPQPNKEKYTNEEFDIALEFTKKLKKEFQDFVRAVVLFGSYAKNNPDKEKSDIDILIIIDDVNIKLTSEIVETYRIIVERIINEVDTRLHITSLKYTTFWEYIRVGDSVGLNILREGVAIIDTGFFKTNQLLLKEGRIKPSPESVWIYFSRAPSTLLNSKWHIMQASLDLYWAVIDSAQAVLMRHGEFPPAPEMLGIVMQDKLLPEKIIKRKHIDTVQEFFTLSKKILHREIKDMPGKQFDEYYHKAYEFINDMKEILSKK